MSKTLFTTEALHQKRKSEWPTDVKRCSTPLAIREMQIRTPVSDSMDWLHLNMAIFKVTKARRHLRCRLVTWPTVPFLGAHLEKPSSRVQETRAMSQQRRGSQQTLEITQLRTWIDFYIQTTL